MQPAITTIERCVMTKLGMFAVAIGGLALIGFSGAALAGNGGCSWATQSVKADSDRVVASASTTTTTPAPERR